MNDLNEDQIHSVTTVVIPLLDDLAHALPADPAERQQILELGLREWHVRHALEAYKRGEGSLAFAAQRAGISLREMIPLAYAHGLSPKVSSDWLAEPLPLDKAAVL